MAGFAETTGSLFAVEQRPEAGLLLRAVDRMTVEAQRFGDEAQVPGPFTGDRIVHGPLDPELVRMAARAEMVAERAKQRRRCAAARRGDLRPKVRVVTAITGDFRQRTRGIHRTGFSGGTGEF